MTNFKMSLRLSAMFVLALAFCCLVIGQAAVADGSGISESRYIPIHGRHLSTEPAGQVTLELKSEFPAETRPVSSGRVNVPRGDRVGGELLANATEITALPYSDAASTAGFADDYDEACTYSSTAPDVVYKYTPTANIKVDASLCGSSYDTKLFVYNSASPTSAYACNEDACGSDGYKSFIGGLQLTAGTTYYFVVDGYDETCFGDYVFELAEYSCVFSCPPGAVAEGGTCGADNNDGPLGTPVQVGAIANGETICGNVWMDGGSRDYDFFVYTLTEYSTVTLTGESDGPVQVLLGGEGSTWTINASSATSTGCGNVVTVSRLFGPGTYWAAIRGQAGAGFPCTAPAGYWMTMSHVPTAMPPANDNCANAAVLVAGLAPGVANAGTTVDATHDGPFSNPAGPNVWYKYTATETGLLTVSMCTGTPDTFDAVLIAWPRYDCATWTGYSFGDNNCGVLPEVALSVTAGTTYTFLVTAWDAAAESDFVLTATFTPPAEPPVNDACENADLRVLTYDVTETYIGTTEWATNDCPDLVDPEVWIAFTLTASCSNVSLNYCAGYEGGPGWSVWSHLQTTCPCTSTDYVSADTLTWVCPDGASNGVMNWDSLPAGTYWFPVNMNNSGGGWEYGINVLATICPPYCVVGSSCDEYITRVQVGTIDNASGVCTPGGFKDYTNEFSTAMYKGVGYPITVTTAAAWPEDQVKGWVDYNLDFLFDDAAGSNEVINFAGNPGVGPFTATITPPVTAISGETTLRVRLRWNVLPIPCTVIGYGETEDYMLVLQDLPCGDVNMDGNYDIADIDYLIAYYFTEGAAPLPIPANGDTNGDCCINLADIVYLADYVFRGGADPVCLPCNP